MIANTYWEFNGRPLRKPTSGEGPSPELLAARWRATAKQ
jgi:hypothetical protein